MDKTASPGILIQYNRLKDSWRWLAICIFIHFGLIAAWNWHYGSAAHSVHGRSCLILVGWPEILGPRDFRCRSDWHWTVALLSNTSKFCFFNLHSNLTWVLVLNCGNPTFAHRSLDSAYFNDWCSLKEKTKLLVKSWWTFIKSHCNSQMFLSWNWSTLHHFNLFFFLNIGQYLEYLSLPHHILSSLCGMILSAMSSSFILLKVGVVYVLHLYVILSYKKWKFVCRLPFMSYGFLLWTSWLVLFWYLS